MGFKTLRLIALMGWTIVVMNNTANLSDSLRQGELTQSIWNVVVMLCGLFVLYRIAMTETDDGR